MFLTVCSTEFWTDRDHEQGEQVMQGHIARRRNRCYAVIYEGLDPVTGKEHHSWHPAGTDPAEAEGRLFGPREYGGRAVHIKTLATIH